MTVSTSRAESPLLGSAIAKAWGGARLSFEEGLLLLERAPFPELGAAADAARSRRHPEGVVTYIVDRNINYTNGCVSRCGFCAFYREPGSPESFVLSMEEIRSKVRETVELGGTGVLLQGGHHPELPFAFYEELLSALRREFPQIHLHCFSPPEVAYFAKRHGMGVPEVLSRLIAAGLMSIPGGGAEILSDAVRPQMAPGKATVKEWLDVMEEAHRQGLRTTATMMFGSVESPRDILIHLTHLRDLQDRTGGFTAFIPWTYQYSEGLPLPASGATGMDYLRVVALSRLYLDNVDHVQASWVTQGLKMAQVALHYGADDLGSVMIEENVVAAAGCTNRTNEAELRRVIADAGFTPRKRRTLYGAATG